ncbi:HepT-like ribonuclease domain-containing protein [Picosynechococcus sp. PCC 8807]|uniref:HepT-like ribonuclease domain-containing protein n=1 Tax=Picosynechococcus sp. PCC 8807 TaxID=195248 RepID=UPI0008108239|nr:HepT-like ribonuclease domain-containing protein [Picosynechococcus sp. PCC 8807]ANV91284.1 nucleotidyltransferase [Picosynechococcus sp. PCC 8807]
MRSDLERLKDIQEAINRIEKYAVQGKQEFRANELIQSWILLQLQTIGEAARAMKPETHAQYPEVDWRDIIDFRNLLVHEYFRVDLEIVWQIVENQIPRLKTQIDNILSP